MSVPGQSQDGDQYPPPAGYGQGLSYGAPPARPRNGFGIAALVLGLLALVLFWTIIGGIIFGILALIFGLIGRTRAKRGESTNGGLALAGVILGVIGALTAIGLIVLGVSVLNSPAGQSYRQCLQSSSGDPAKIQQCASEFGRQFKGG